MDNSTLIYNNVEIEKNKADRILIKLIKLEKENLKTKRLNDREMVRKIMKLIEEEVQCY